MLKPGGVVYLNTMCGEVRNPALRKNFDPVSRCLMYRGKLATRYIGVAEDIVAEVRQAGFHILGWRINPPQTPTAQDDALIAALKPFPA